MLVGTIILKVLNRGLTGQADERFGKGELRRTGRIKHHGDPHIGFRFNCHPRNPDFGKAAPSRVELRFYTNNLFINQFYINTAER